MSQEHVDDVAFFCFLIFLRLLLRQQPKRVVSHAGHQCKESSATTSLFCWIHNHNKNIEVPGLLLPSDLLLGSLFGFFLLLFLVLFIFVILVILVFLA